MFEQQTEEMEAKNNLLMELKLKVDALEAGQSHMQNKKRQRPNDDNDVTDDLTNMFQTVISNQSATFAKMIEKIEARQADMATAIDLIHNAIRTPETPTCRNFSRFFCFLYFCASLPKKMTQ